jgi:hypothetical protein
MAPWEVLPLVVWVGWAFGGYEIEKHKGLPSPSLILGLLVGVVGVITADCVRQTQEAKVGVARPSDPTNLTEASTGNI